MQHLRVRDEEMLEAVNLKRELTKSLGDER